MPRPTSARWARPPARLARFPGAAAEVPSIDLVYLVPRTSSPRGGWPGRGARDYEKNETIIARPAAYELNEITRKFYLDVPPRFRRRFI
jgi:hypothetical protein